MSAIEWITAAVLIIAIWAALVWFVERFWTRTIPQEADRPADDEQVDSMRQALEPWRKEGLM